jgi:hypothetical protein
MLFRIVADVVEMSALAAFLAMIWLWAGALGRAAGI